MQLVLDYSAQGVAFPLNHNLHQLPVGVNPKQRFLSLPALITKVKNYIKSSDRKPHDHSCSAPDQWKTQLCRKHSHRRVSRAAIACSHLNAHLQISVEFSVLWPSLQPSPNAVISQWGLHPRTGSQIYSWLFNCLTADLTRASTFYCGIWMDDQHQYRPVAVDNTIINIWGSFGLTTLWELPKIALLTAPRMDCSTFPWILNLNW